MRAIWLSISLLLASSPAAAGQLAFAQDAEHHTVVLSGLAGPPDETCEERPFQGTVVSRSFDTDGTTLNGFVVERRDGTRTFINVEIPDGLDMARRGFVYDGLQRLTRIGRTARGRVQWCGAAGRVGTLDDIR